MPVSAGIAQELHLFAAKTDPATQQILVKAWLEKHRQQATTGTPEALLDAMIKDGTLKAVGSERGALLLAIQSQREALIAQGAKSAEKGEAFAKKNEGTTSSTTHGKKSLGSASPLFRGRGLEVGTSSAADKKRAPSKAPKKGGMFSLFRTAKVKEVAPKPDPHAALRQRVFDAQAAYVNGDYKAAHELLTSVKTAKEQFGLRLDVHTELIQDPNDATERAAVIAAARKHNMRFDSKLQLSDAGVMNPAKQELRSLDQLPAYAQELIPLNLEEWMHELQNRQGGPISSLMEPYLKARKQKWDQDKHGEIDILAAFREWRFPVDALGTAKAHADVRGDFEHWYQHERKA